MAEGPSGRGFAASQSWRRTLAEVGVVVAALLALLLVLRGASGCIASAVVSRLPPSADAAIGKSAAEATRAQHGTSEPPTAEQTQRAERVFEELRAHLTPDETSILVAPRITVLVDPQV